jgi:hypothetical protein
MADTLVVRSRRAKRAKNAQTAQHVVAALILIGAAWPHLHHRGTSQFYFALAEVAGAAALIGSVILARIRHHKAKHGRIGWVEVAGGLMLYVEALGKTREIHHASFYVVQFIPAVVLLTFGFFEAAIVASRYLKATDDRLLLRLRLFWWRSAAWETLRGYRILPKHLVLELKSGETKRIRIADIENREEAEAWLGEQLEKRGVVRAE